MKNTSDPALSTVQTTLGSIAFCDRGEGVPIILWPSLFTTHGIFDAMILTLDALPAITAWIGCWLPPTAH
ncbi:hypothetical protein [Chamaesiphon sp.]|uniref:hypothetical protein n=1 Tax=Chamaesiphon sp. TaxID=2814140 RepID=UPI003592FD85